MNKKKNNNKIGKHKKNKKKNFISLKISNLKKEHTEKIIKTYLTGFNFVNVNIIGDYGYINFKTLQDAQVAEEYLKTIDGNNNKKIKVNYKNNNNNDIIK